ncbi:transporter substrate-binding domain-containing protein [Salidesulfovibrio onnuriiensis]|uniref:transporter substrate-binding domain-containing protein n=1 Tax=Salidesulfovibrio onnuriiensis TaxID=2583823 RepID=UPI001650165E|nr:transporter substrate-binding domain-containing protein [Salidesulfovibrio onnuriiensis]
MMPEPNQSVSLQEAFNTALVSWAFLAVLCLAILLSCPLSAQSAPLKIRGDHDYPPYEFIKDGQPTGFNVDIMKAVARVMGLDVDISLGPWSTVRKQLEHGEIDALTGMYYSQERDEKVDFSTNHIVVHHSIFTRKGSPIKNLKDLVGKSVIVQSADIMDDFAKRELTGSSIIEVVNQDEALRLLAGGKYDAALLATLQGLYNAQKYGLDNITTVGAPLEPRDYCFAVPEGHVQLLAKLNEGLAIIRQTGEYRQIYDKWFGRYGQPDSNSTIAYLKTAIVVLTAFVLAACIWAWMERRKKTS